MKIKAFSFEQNSFKLAELKQRVISVISESGIYFESFSDPNLLFEEISKALNDTDVILIGVESNLFLKFKPVLIKAFNFTPAYSEKINNAISADISEEKLRKAHTLVPNESIELVSKDGIYSGFYVKSEEQTIVVFPLTENSAPHILVNSDLPFFKKPEIKDDVFRDIQDPEKASEKAKSIVSKLAENGLQLALPSTPAAKLLKEDIKLCEEYESAVHFTPFVNDKGAEEPKEYTAQLAKVAMNLKAAALGAAISNIFREKKSENNIIYYSYISVATEDKTVVKKLFANSAENVDNLIIEATNELYSMIDKYIDETVFKLTATAEEKEKYEKALIEAEYQAENAKNGKTGKKGLIAAIIALILALALCIFLFLHNGGYFVNATDAPEESLQMGNPVHTQGETQTQAPPETVTEPSTEEPSTQSDIIEFVSQEESSTSIFDVYATTTLVPVYNTNANINYRPNNNTTKHTTEEETTEKQTTTEKETTEKQTTTQKETTTEMEIIEF